MHTTKMTILEGLKRIKHLGRKIDQVNERIKKWCSHYSNVDPLYTDMRALVQSVVDMSKEQTIVQHRIHLTNANTIIEYKGTTLSIDELLAVRTRVLPAERLALVAMRRKEPPYRPNKDDEKITVITNYDPKKRDQRLEEIEFALEEIDNLLDRLNMVTLLLPIER